MHSGCSALSRTVTRVAPLSGTVTRVALLSGTVTQTVPLSGTVTQTVPRENLQIALCYVLFVPDGLSPIQCNSRPIMTQKGLGRLDNDLKTN
ncbi:hypothetical protein F2Q70_00018672 [Brassica cretica]|uniref:Uncharacterized protein n=1 Tax=Brassica cretica TaxID=69181 RepID=A0A8S9HY97_BRACR|nr:hypothetical protein F2Q70_00018672 [Brassica cretica]